MVFRAKRSNDHDTSLCFSTSPSPFLSVVSPVALRQRALQSYDSVMWQRLSIPFTNDMAKLLAAPDLIGIGDNTDFGIVRSCDTIFDVSLIGDASTEEYSRSEHSALVTHLLMSL